MMDPSERRPPFRLRRLLGWFAPERDRVHLLRDLDELFAVRARDRGSSYARRWYAREVLRFVVALAWDALRRRGRRVDPGAGRASGWLAGLRHDVRVSARVLRRSPTYLLAVALTLGLGIAANGTVYALANRVLLRPVPGVSAPAELVRLRLQVDQYVDRISNPDAEDLARSIPVLPGVTSTSSVDVHIGTGVGTPLRVSGELVGANYFDVLGVRLAGRGFVPEEGRSPGVRTAVVSERLAQRLFGEAVLKPGQTLHVNGRTFQLVGITRGAFRGAELPGRTDVWFPPGAFADVISWLHPNMLTHRGEPVWHYLIGRRSTQLDLDLIEAQANAALDRLRPEVRPGRRLTPEQHLRVYDGIGVPVSVRSLVQRTLALMAGGAVLLLLLASANATNLALSRAVARQDQMVVRRALGASGWRLTRLSLVENVLLGLAAGAVGALLTVGGVHLFRDTKLGDAGAALAGTAVDARVLAFLILASIGAGILFGMVPAWYVRRIAPARLLQAGIGVRSTGELPRATLVVMQFALSVILLIGAALLGRTIWNLQQVPLGLDARGVIMTSLEPELQGHGADRRRAFSRDLLQQLRALPQLDAAALMTLQPYASSYYAAVMRLPGQAEAKRVTGRNFKISDGLFGLLHIDLLAGRDFNAQDLQGNDRVVILNETAALALFQRLDVVGRDVVRGNDTYRVVGIVRDARLHSVTEPLEPFLFEPLNQPAAPAQLTVLARAHGSQQAALSTITGLVSRLDPDLPTYQAQPLRDQIETLTSNQRTAARLGAILAALGIVLAGIGVYAALANRVVVRRRELSIRLAIGASPRQLTISILRNGLLLSSMGSLAGLAGAAALSGALQSLLWGVQRFDGWTYAAVLILTTLPALCASALPARQVLNTNPLESLRE